MKLDESMNMILSDLQTIADAQTAGTMKLKAGHQVQLLSGTAGWVTEIHRLFAGGKLSTLQLSNVVYSAKQALHFTHVGHPQLTDPHPDCMKLTLWRSTTLLLFRFIRPRAHSSTKAN